MNRNIINGGDHRIIADRHITQPTLNVFLHGSQICQSRKKGRVVVLDVDEQGAILVESQVASDHFHHDHITIAELRHWISSSQRLDSSDQGIISLTR
ncbi:hypothetical protein [Dictyobacter kobayashii]|nr:hypothetical protein [Dictyobacter kobayashii]